jgi:hypothetical protein
MFGSEGGEEEQGQNLNFLQNSYRSMVRAYEKRFSLVDEVRARLNTSLLESEAVWDGEVKSRFAPIFKLQHELLMNVRNYLITINPEEQEDRAQAYMDILAQRRDVLYETPLDGDDVFKSELDAALSTVEAYLRPKLIN